MSEIEDRSAFIPADNELDSSNNEVSLSSDEETTMEVEECEVQESDVELTPATTELTAEDEALANELEAMAQGEVADLCAKVTEIETKVTELTDEVARRKADIYNLQQEYAGYVKRARADLVATRGLAAGEVVEALLPVIDEVHLARLHGDLEAGPFKAIAQKLESILEQKYELARFGEPGEIFDPNMHEALMAVEDENISEPTIKEVMQPGYRLGEKIVRPARVLVANPKE